MKQLTILSGRCLVVELQEGAHSPVVDDYLLGFNLPAHLGAGDWSDDSYDTIKLPPGNWHIVGMLSEVTGEQVEELVEWVVSKTSSGTIKKYRDYRVKTVSWGLVENAIESLESSILAEGYLFDNPRPMPTYEPKTRQAHVAKIEEMALHKETQSRVLDRSRCLLLGREDL